MADVLVYQSEQLGKPFTVAELFHQVILRQTGLTLDFVNAATLHDKLTPEVQLFILPGAAASATYRKQISGNRCALLHQRVTEGMQVLGICAGAYVLCETFDYTFYDELTGAVNERRIIAPELALAKARATGPDLRLHPLRPYNSTARWSGYDAVKVSYDNRLSPMLALGNGPRFTSGPNTRPLAHYSATGDVAMLAFTHGHGGGILSGPALEVGGVLQYRPTEKTLQAYPHLATALQLMAESKQEWAEMWIDLLPRLLPRATPHQQASMASNLRRHIVSPLPRRIAAKTVRLA